MRNYEKKGKENRMKLTREILEEMAAVAIQTVDSATLTDLREIKIDSSWSVEKKLEAFANQTKNIYVNRIGEYIVKVRFQERGATIDEKMAEYLRRLSEGYL